MFAIWFAASLVFSVHASSHTPKDCGPELVRPPTLYRVVKGELQFSRDGFLVSHSQVDNSIFWDDGVSSSNETLPLVSQIDIDIIARFILNPANVDPPVTSFLVQIDPQRVQNFSGKKHPVLKDFEYFALVPRTAILKVSKIRFIRIPADFSLTRADSKVVEHILKTTKDFKLEILD